MTKPDASSRIIRKLNPGFLAQHGIAPLRVRDGRLEVAMHDCENQDAIAALRFATGLEITALPLDVCQRAAAGKREARKLSLLDHIQDYLQSRGHAERLFAPLILLLEAGYGPTEAGERLLSLPELDPRLLGAAQSLAAGQPIGMIVTQVGLWPWLTEAIEQCADGEEVTIALIISVIRPGPLTFLSDQATRIVTECVILCLPLAIVLRAMVAETALLLVVIALVLFSSVRFITATRADSNFVRADVLGLVARLATLLPPAVAIRAGFARLTALTGTSYRQDTRREALSAALALPGLPDALLVHGELAEAAERTSAFCLTGGNRQLTRVRWILRSIVVAAFATSMMLMAT